MLKVRKQCVPKAIIILLKTLDTNFLQLGPPGSGLHARQVARFPAPDLFETRQGSPEEWIMIITLNLTPSFVGDPF
jgi:hypothetical protein